MTTDNDDDFDEATQCGVFVDLGERCGKTLARIVAEPFTPGAFEIECCENCAARFIDDGYKVIK